MVSVELKGAASPRQVGSMKANASEPLMKGRNGLDDVKTGALKGSREQCRRRPVCDRHDIRP